MGSLQATIILLLQGVLLLVSSQQVTHLDNEDSPSSNGGGLLLFTPTVTALCTRSKIIITTQTNEPFHGVISSRGLRNNSACLVEGRGATTTVLQLDTANQPTDISDPDFCRILTNQATGEKSVHVSVRQHKTLELANDKNYLVQCNKLNSAPPAVPLPARLYLASSSSSRSLKEVVNARSYKLILKTNHAHFTIKNCIAFGGSNTDAATSFFDNQGCPVSRITSKWTQLTPTSSETTIFQMFRFQESNQVTLQCTVTFCEKQCDNEPDCQDTLSPQFFKDTNALALTNSTTTTSVIASTTVAVLNPGDPLAQSSDEEDEEVCRGRFCPLWLLWVAITLGVLFLLMLLVNLCLCTALTCTCTRTELIEKDPSILEDYDPYNNRTWEQYSNHNKQFSESLASADHYATPSAGHQRPDSRFSKK